MIQWMNVAALQSSSGRIQMVPKRTRHMNSTRKSALAAGVFYLLTFVSIPTLGLYAQVRDTNYIVGSSPGRLHREPGIRGTGTAGQCR
jgi:hypothetical protein